jgi:two-component system, OmpR family, sensor kinase
MTLRRRVFAYVAAAAAASCALTVAVGVLLVRHEISTQRMAALERQANLLATVGGAPGALGAGQHVYVVGARRPRRLGPVRSAAVLASIPASGESQGTVNVRGRGVLYVARVTAAGRIVLVRSAKLAFSEWRPFLWSLLLAGLGGALLAAICSYLLARRLTRPIGELSAATSRVAAGESGVEVDVHGEDELAELASAFNRMSAELTRAREAQRSFLESVSHELKTPLTSIRGYAEAVNEGAVEPSEAGPVIAWEADRLDRLVQDLLDLARFGRAEFSVARDRVDLGSIAAQAVERHQPRARELSVELLVEHSSTGAVAGGLGDADRLLQATSNLIENALRLTPAGGSVTVRAEPGALSVRDTGPGLAPEDLPRAFEQFYLYDRYRSERAVGSGLGLTIVHALALAMGGSVEAASAPGGGAQFTIRLPKPQGRPAVPAAAAAARSLDG